MLYSDPKPSIVLVDEFENSLHNSMIDHLIDLYRNAGDVCTIISTHSPLVIDAVDIEDIFILEYDPRSGCTTIRKFENPVELRNVLANQGLSPSDYWLFSD
ncbi:MAG: AAA family ATPase [Thermoplasmata archaeon]